MARPFYTVYAWAYDLLIPGPVADRVAFIQAQLARRQVLQSARVLDAGCGTGSYSIALAERGYTVTGLDSSADLIAEAKRKAEKRGVRIEFVLGDILKPPAGLTVDAIFCRGVLNDLTEERSRRRVFFSFASAMHQAGVLILDVREWNTTVARKTENPVYERTVQTERGKLTFRSVTELQPETRSLVISETHVLESPDGRQVTPFGFVMKCWTQEELVDYLAAAGFDSAEYFGDYDSEQAVGVTDRLIVVATLNRR